MIHPPQQTKRSNKITITSILFLLLTSGCNSLACLAMLRIRQKSRLCIFQRIFGDAFEHANNGHHSSLLPFLQRSSSTITQPNYDPSTKRPNQKCDPYGQGGKPLTMTDATMLKSTIHPQWTLEIDEKNEKEPAITPTSLTRQFLHPDYLSGARFLQKIAAVAQINNHFPSALSLERRIVKKNWQVVSVVNCRTVVLGGLSRHDFHLAMVSLYADVYCLCRHNVEFESQSRLSLSLSFLLP